MKYFLLFVALMLPACTTSPDIKADNIKDGTVVCATVIGPWGSGKTVIAKLDQGVIRDGGSVSVDGNCIMSVQLAPPAPKPVSK